MPARIVIVHDEHDFVAELTSILSSSGHDVATFPDPLAAWDTLEAAQHTEVLVTRIEFPPGLSNGLALALMARSKRPQMRILFTALPQYADDADGVGEFLSMPVNVTDAIEAITRLLNG